VRGHAPKNREKCLLREGPLLDEQFARLFDKLRFSEIYIQGRSGRFQLAAHGLRVVAQIVLDSIHTLQLHGYSAGMNGGAMWCPRRSGRKHQGSQGGIPSSRRKTYKPTRRHAF
jgi:hypothetical protein